MKTALTLLAWLLASVASVATAAPLDTLDAAVPRDVAGLLNLNVPALQQAARAVDDWAFANTQLTPASGIAARRAPSPLTVVRTALEVKARVDALLDRVLNLRTTITSLAAEPPDDPERRQAARGFLNAATVLIDLSGRLRYSQNDVVRIARGRLTDAASREQLAALFLQYKSTVGATQTADDPFSFPGRQRYHELILRLIAASGQTSLLPQVVRYIDDPSQGAPMRLFAAEIIRVLGLPQPPRPNPVEKLPDPAITPDEFYQLVEAIAPAELDAEGQARRSTLLEWSDGRRKKGVTEDAYQVGSFAVRPGDWLLMRNPSPYNLFTDLSPGLFTHVGIVATETGADGIRRFVIVDVPERGDRVPAVNVEIYLERTLHYFFLRDGDAKAAAAMARAGSEVIDNASQFDLNFRSDRVERLAHKSLADEKVHTYCAGLLLLCALQTDVPRSEYFPLAEKQAGGRTVENVAKMGLSLGEGFLSPSGALYSSRMKIVGRREPMYDPRREVEEAVFDQFAKLLVVRDMQARGDWFDALRLKTAEAAKANPLLAQALAGAAGVAAETDLVAAAKAAAVVETLDEVALAAGADFQAARDALRNAPFAADTTADDRTRRANVARRHAGLIQALQQGRIAPREARRQLVSYYIQAGNAELERRFFGGR
jgi:hypothetical protein